jgi:hypothetical protein
MFSASVLVALRKTLGTDSDLDNAPLVDACHGSLNGCTSGGGQNF